MSALDAAEVQATGDWLASCQLPSGMIPWFAGGHADPWNHVEAAMALLLAGRQVECERAFDWLASTQLPDGGWCVFHLEEGVEDPRRDPNPCAYVATGVWWHFLRTGDLGFAETQWPMVDRSIAFVLRLAQPGGEIAWSLDPDGVVGRYALLTGNSSIHHSLRCATALADLLGHERPEWELAASRVAQAVRERPDRFAPKRRWAMDWYYPVLTGVVTGLEARRRLLRRWDAFVMDGLGVRCVSDQPWVTAAETAECAMAAQSAGLAPLAQRLLGWTRHLRDGDGAYWTGCVHPQCVRFPGGERSTYSAAAVLLADHTVYGSGPSAELFQGGAVGLAYGDLDELPEPVTES
jgi:hypothetical protein